MKMKKTIIMMLAAVVAVGAVAQNDDTLPIGVGPIVAIDAIKEKAKKDGNAEVLNIIVRGLETALTAELSNNDSPFSLVGGNIGANLYKKYVLEQKSPTETDGEDIIRYGLSVEITAFTDVKIGPVQSGGLTVFQREITVMASALLHDVGAMRAAIAIPSVMASSKSTYNVRSVTELNGVIAQSDMTIGEVQADLAKKLAEGLLKAYFKFPAYILDVDGDEVTIDQGSSWCKVGEELNVFGPPTAVETATRGRIKQSTVRMMPGKKVGTLTVTDIFGNMSRGTLKGTLPAEIDGVVYKKGE